MKFLSSYFIYFKKIGCYVAALFTSNSILLYCWFFFKKTGKSITVIGFWLIINLLFQRMKIIFFYFKIILMSIDNYLLKYKLKPNLKVFLLGLFVLGWATLLNAQTKISVHGTVVDQTGKPVAFASVIVKGTSTGTGANEAGVFELNVAPGKTLVVSSIGHETKEVVVQQGDNNITVVLTQTTSESEQVIVVGYGTQRKRDVTGSVSSVNEQALHEVPSSNIQGALQGKAAGLEIQNTGTMPGANMQIRIRGIRTISGSNTPLLVLDGIPYDGSLNDINPDDVMSIEVLKDASATAIYGSRGSNGVILVTTKRGKGGPARISYNGYYGYGNVAWKYPVFNVPEYEAMRASSTWTAGYMPLEQLGMQNGTNTNWQNAVYQSAQKTDNNLTVSGGNTDGSTYSLGAGYYKETAVLPGEDFTRFSLRATIDTKIGKHAKIGLNTLNTYGITNGSQFVQYGYMYPILTLSPLSAVDTNGVMVLNPAGNPNDYSGQYNPLLTRNNNNNWVDKVGRFRSFNSLYAEYEFIPGLKYRLNLGLNYTREEDDQFKGQDTKQTPQYFNVGKGNNASVNNTEGWGYTAENLIVYDKTIATKHRINFTGLYSIQEAHSHNTFVSKDSIDQDFVQFYNLGQANTTHPPVVSGGESSMVLLSYMARLNYVYDNRYMLTVTYRNDGSSVLADGHKWHQYPAVSAGWNITNEKFVGNFFSNAKINNLKLRAGFGQTSNQSIAPYTSLGLFSNSNGQGGTAGVIKYNYGPTVLTGYNLVSLPNPSLDWEYTKTINLGLDFGILNNRIIGNIDYYHQHTNKILYNVGIPPTSGISSNSFFTNVGEMQNWGMEFAVSSINIKTHSGFTWSTDLNLFFNRNKLLKLSNGVTQDIANQLFVGYSMTSIYDYKKLGIWQTSEAAQAAKYNSVPGQLKIQDYDNNGVIDANDRHIIGNGDAKLQGGMTNRFAYKGFDLSVVMYARFGGLLISQIHQPTGTYLTQMSGDRNQIRVDYWTPNNPTNWFPSPSRSLAAVPAAMTTLGYYDASFLKIRSINLGYTFSPAMLKRISAQNIRIYASVDNVATLFSPYQKQTGIDPEGTGTGDQSVGGVGNIRTGKGDNNTITLGASTPPTRNFIIGLNLTF
jgi:TonB-linked SusC/RagA family outer membrane protein